MDRRDFLKEAILLVGGATALSTLPGCSWRDAPNTIPADVKKRLVRIADIMIPRTKIFGAADVETAGFVEKLIANWASAETRGKLLALLGSADLVALDTMDDARATAALTDYDAAAFGTKDENWKILKGLFMLGYFGSEKYQTEIVKFKLVPGRYDPCAKLEETLV